MTWNRTFLEMDSMVFSWWIVAFLHSVPKQTVRRICGLPMLYTFIASGHITIYKYITPYVHNVLYVYE